MTGLRKGLLFIFIIFSFVTVTFGGALDNINVILEPIKEGCRKSIGIKKDEVAKGNIDKPTNKYGCYINCIMQDSGMIDEKGKIDWNYMEAMSFQKLYGKAWTKCRNTKAGPGKCDTAVNYFKCVKKAEPQVFKYM